MPKVFIPQVAERYDAASGRRVPTFDFAPAAQFGQLTPILERDDNPLFLARITPKIQKALESFAKDDYLLAVGDPSVIAICAGILLRRQNTLNLLKWDKKLSNYITLSLNL